MNLLTNIDSRTELKITVADLRDLLNATSLLDNDIKQEEINHLLKCICRKNKMPDGSLNFS